MRYHLLRRAHLPGVYELGESWPTALYRYVPCVSVTWVVTLAPLAGVAPANGNDQTLVPAPGTEHGHSCSYMT